jgi:hypothetical protein
VDFSCPEEDGLHYFSCEKTRSLLVKRTHKFGIEVPKTVKEALELDKKNCNTFWAEAIAKGMKDICVAFKILLDR